VNDYVPYEERVRRKKEAEAAAVAAAAAAHSNGIKAVANLLTLLDGSCTDCYLEILRPLGGGIQRYFNKKTIVTRPGLSGGPEFVISEVLSAYLVPKGIVPPPSPEGDIYPFDAHLVPDGRVWRHSGEGVAPNTYQLLDSTANQLSSLPTDDLERIAADLQRRLPRHDS
jgi:hypothetical protein